MSKRNLLAGWLKAPINIVLEATFSRLQRWAHWGVIKVRLDPRSRKHRIFSNWQVLELKKSKTMVSNLVCSDDGIEHAMSHNSGQSGGGCSVDLHDAQNGPGSTNPKPPVACCIEVCKGLSSAASEGCLGNGRQSRSRTLPCKGCTWAARVPPAGSSSWEATVGTVAAGAGTSGSIEGIVASSRHDLAYLC